MSFDIQAWASEVNLPRSECERIASKVEQYLADCIHDADPNAFGSPETGTDIYESEDE